MKPASPHGLWWGLEQLEGRSLLAAVSWDGGGGDFSWHNPLNWSGDVVPGPADDVLINVAGNNPTITHSQSVTTSLKSLKCNEFLTISAGNVGTSGLWRQNAPLTFSGGKIGGAGHIEVNAGLTWTVGQMIGAGTTKILPTGTLNIDGDVTLARSVVNNGTTNWKSGSIDFAGGTFLNLFGRIFNAQSGEGMLNGVGTNLFTNAGTLRRNGTSGTESRIMVKFNSTYQVEATQGRLHLGGGGTAYLGNIIAGAGATVAFADKAYVINPGVHLKGAGTASFEGAAQSVNGPVDSLGHLRVTQGAATFAGGGTVSKVTFSGGTLVAQTILNVTGPMSWTAGNLTGLGQVNIGAGAVVTVSGAATRVLACRLENAGKINWTGGKILLNGGEIENEGVFIAAGPALTASSGTADFTNTGTLVKSGAGQTIVGTQGGGAVRLINTGPVNVQAGELFVNGGGSAGGTVSILGGATLTVASPAYALSGATFTGGGTLRFGTGQATATSVQFLGTGATAILTGGKVDLIGGASKIGRALSNAGTLTWSGGSLALATPTINNTGVVNIAVGTGLTTVGEVLLNNVGTLNTDNTTSMSMNGVKLRLNNTGVVNVNSGTFALPQALVNQVSSGTLTGGTWNALNGSTLNFSTAWITTNKAKVTLSGFGAHLPAFEPLNSNLGTLAIMGGAQVLLQPQGGTITNTGALTVGALSLITFQGNLVLASQSTLTIQVAGDGEANLGRVQVSGAATVGGKITASFVNGFNPDIGSQFTFGNAASSSGSFSQVAWTGLPVGKKATVTIDDEGARFTVEPA